MHSLVIEPTFENILNTFEQDALGRNKDLVCFVEMLNSIDGSCSISLDAPWGAGKTFFVKQVKMILDAFNENINKTHTEYDQRIKAVWDKAMGNEDAEIQPFVSVYYDAWQNDNDKDPIISLVYSIVQSMSVEFVFETKQDFPKAAAGVIECLTGKPVGQLVEKLQGNNALEEISQEKNLQEVVEKFWESLLLEKGNRLVIFIDELDRCNPAYAIKLLERIKHYFSNEQITFVFSVNLAELQHSVRKFYGAGFDASRYLDRFFDLRLDLPPVSNERFYYALGVANDRMLNDVCEAVIQQNHFSFREIARFLSMVKMATGNKDKYDLSFPDGRAIDFCLRFVVPIMIGLKISDYTKYKAFIGGQDCSPMVDFFKNTQVGSWWRAALLGYNETYDEPTRENETKVSIEEKVKLAYNALFVKEFTGRDYAVKTREFEFSSETREVCFRAVSALSKYADYGN